MKDDNNKFNQSKYIQQYMKDNVLVKKVVFNKNNEGEIIKWISEQNNFSAYIKSLIIKDMAQLKNS